MRKPTLTIKAKKNHAGDKQFLMPERCFHCAHPANGYAIELHQRKAGMADLVGPFIGILAHLLPQKTQMVCYSFICGTCNDLNQDLETAKKLYWPITLITTCVLFGITAVIAYFNQAEEELYISSALLILLICIFGVKILYTLRTKAYIRASNPDHQPNGLVHEVRLTKHYFIRKSKAVYSFRARFQSADFIRDFIKINAPTAEISYSDRRWRRLKKRELSQ